MQPADADDPEKSAWLHEFFEKVWDPDQPRQRDYFLAWFKRFYQNALEGHPVSGQAAVIAGQAGIGKTFPSSSVCLFMPPLLLGMHLYYCFGCIFLSARDPSRLRCRIDRVFRCAVQSRDAIAHNCRGG
jgi:hypothetical protein